MPDRLEVGWISKPHSLNGDVLVKAISNVEGRFRAGVRLEAKKGERTLEVEIVSCRPYKDRLLVHFLGVDSREAAEEVQGALLLGEAGEYGDDALLVHEIIGAQVIDLEGVVRGSVVSVEANPASDLLVLDNGKLVPMVFVSDFNKQQKVVVVDTPAGLFDL